MLPVRKQNKALKRQNNEIFAIFVIVLKAKGVVLSLNTPKHTNLETTTCQLACQLKRVAQ